MGRFFIPLLMTDADSDTLKDMFISLKKLRIANGDDLAEIISIVYFVSIQRQIAEMESDYDDQQY